LAQNEHLKGQITRLTHEVEVLQESKDILENELLEEQRDTVMEKDIWKE
jgi:hypothetical protein